MADCTCANPNAVADAIKNHGNETVTQMNHSSTQVDETLHGEAHGGEHGMLDTIRFCHWAAPEYGPKGESGWNTFWRAVQLAIAILNSTIQQQIADKQMDLAEGYYEQAKFKLDRFMNKYKPLEIALLKEVSTVAEPKMNCVDDRDRAETAVNTAYDVIDQYVAMRSKGLRLCVDDSAMAQLNHGRALMLVDTENYNLRDDTWFTDYKSDQRWGRRSNVLNLGRNLGSIAMKYGDVARALSEDVGGLFNRATASLSMALGYYGTRFDTYTPSTYLGTAGNANNILNVGTGNTATNAASGGF